MTAETDLSHAEAIEAFQAFAASVGPKASLSVSLNVNSGYRKSALMGFFYPEDHGPQKASFILDGDSYREVLGACEEKWAEHRALHATNMIREMALKIISITADQGECTDAALRATFDAADVARYGERACESATEMASNGPFSIVKLAGANQNEAA